MGSLCGVGYLVLHSRDILLNSDYDTLRSRYPGEEMRKYWDIIVGLLILAICLAATCYAFGHRVGRSKVFDGQYDHVNRQEYGGIGASGAR